MPVTCGVSLHRNVLWLDIKLLPKLHEIICLMRLWFFHSCYRSILNSSLCKYYSFSISEAGKLNSRNFCRGSSWLSHFQWRFLMGKISTWSLLHWMELGNKLSEQWKPKELWSKYLGMEIFFSSLCDFFVTFPPGLLLTFEHWWQMPLIKRNDHLQIFCIYFSKWNAPSQNCVLVCCLALNQE